MALGVPCTLQTFPTNTDILPKRKIQVILLIANDNPETLAPIYKERPGQTIDAVVCTRWGYAI